MLLDNIKALCKARGISIFVLERELGIGNGAIAKWESSDPRIGNVKKVADYFDTTVDKLLSPQPAQMGEDKREEE